MADGRRRPGGREGLAYFGAMGAGLSHELSNVFNIINELSGLQQDIVAAAGDGGSAGLARVADLAARIKSQAGRGEDINRGLHRLSHSVDDPDTSYEIGDVLELFGALAARSARLAEVALDVRPPAAAMSHRGDPFALLVCLHACLQTALAAATAARRIEVTAEPGPGGSRIILSSADPLPDPADDAVSAGLPTAGCSGLPAVLRRERDAGGVHRIVLDLGDAAEASRGDREQEA